MSEHRAPTTSAADLALLAADPAAFFAVTPPPGSASPIRAWLAETIRAARAEAWENGWNAYADAINLADSREYPNPDRHPNPYEEDRHVGQ